ncbi:hypothetical protein BGW80DRAFT_1351815 [Lactifluus volemus]|nr:hypothetical protein BGW80DRAFT_1351815 [Lactifluus volemus]
MDHSGQNTSHVEEYGEHGHGLDVVVDQSTTHCQTGFKKIVARHFDDVHSKPVKCPQCDYMFVGRRKLRAHLESAHQAGSSS